ncbi:hypothetical protein [Paracoccus yeei]|nr:hypothetical protein [Paracoccus yeei]
MGVICNPGSSGSLEYANDFRHLILRIEPRMLLRKVMALTGHTASPFAF